MVVIDPWSVVAACIQLAAVGFSPFCIPIVLFMHFGFREEWWSSLVGRINCFEFMGLVLPTTAVAVYWLNGLCLLMVDRLVRPDVLSQFKIQPDKRFDQQKIFKVVVNLLVGQFLVIYPYGLVCGWLDSHTFLGLTHVPQLPSGRRMCLETIFFILFDELLFYYSHWMLHSKVFGVNLYTMIHKVHHEFTSPIGLTASYAHPIEVLVSNAMPLTFGSAMIKAHSYSIWCWTAFAVLGTQFHHCGYRWPWVPGMDHNPDFHDFHHQKFTCNYGLLGVLDTLHGTNKQWLEHLKSPEMQKQKSHTMSRVIFGSATLAVVGSFLLQLA